MPWMIKYGASPAGAHHSAMGLLVVTSDFSGAGVEKFTHRFSFVRVAFDPGGNLRLAGLH
jgi:hypothetical protein